MKIVILSFLGIGVFSCDKNIQPKPSGFLKLEYPEASYQKQNFYDVFTFEKSIHSKVEINKKSQFKLLYPNMKATIYINYKSVKNNLQNLLKDAQKLTYNHSIKATEIVEHPYIDKKNKVYGMFYNVMGDVATNIQFYATDSLNHFVVGTLYFYTRPNFDSIYPATKYIEKDMVRFLESIKWGNN